jgi:hypothetical protein
MERSITIARPPGGRTMYCVLQHALKVLDSAGVSIDAAAQNVHSGLPISATILLRNRDDKSRALQILQRAGIFIQK